MAEYRLEELAGRLGGQFSQHSGLPGTRIARSAASRGPGLHLRRTPPGSAEDDQRPAAQGFQFGSHRRVLHQHPSGSRSRRPARSAGGDLRPSARNGLGSSRRRPGQRRGRPGVRARPCLARRRAAVVRRTPRSPPSWPAPTIRWTYIRARCSGCTTPQRGEVEAVAVVRSGALERGARSPLRRELRAACRSDGGVPPPRRGLPHPRRPRRRRSARCSRATSTRRPQCRATPPTRLVARGTGHRSRLGLTPGWSRGRRRSAAPATPE